jgi:SOS-response transcriptional repressor LexA
MTAPVLAPMKACNIPLQLRELLRWMLVYQDIHGYPPTVVGITRGCELPSISATARLLERLDAAGLIRNDGGARAMDLRPGRAALEQL